MLYEDYFKLELEGKPGDWCFINNDTYIVIRLHEGDRGIAILRITHGETPDIMDRPFWQWDGNKEEPTLSPSIKHWGNGKEDGIKPTCHVYLRKGRLVQA